MKKANTMMFFQKLSKAFLTPLALIASASLVMGVASFFTSADIISAVPFLGNPMIQYVFKVLLQMGSIITGNFAALYAVALPFALVDEDKEYAAFAGFVGYLSFLTGMGMLVQNFPSIAEMFPGNGLTTVLGIETVNAGMLGGILVGILTSLLHKKFRNVVFPMAFSFFQGVRFVPIISLFFFMVLGNLFPFVWVFISMGINGLATLLNQMGVFGLWLYGFVERLLIPTGLHQIWISVVRDTSVSGIFEFASGAIIEGQRPAFMQFLAEGLPLNTTLRELVKFSYGPQIPIMLGALPAIGLAIYKCADKDKRKMVKPVIIAGVMTAMIAGISEPLEFIFLFTAPVLYVIYAVLYGLSWVFMYLLGNQIGYGSGIIEFVVFGLLRSDSHWWICVFVTIGEFVANFFIFRWFILKFNVKTPGRGGDYDASLAVMSETGNDKTETEAVQVTDPKALKALTIIKGLGGKENIEEVDSCMSRLRVVLKDGSLVDKEILNKTGCTAIRVIDDRNIQLIYGTTVGIIKDSVKKQLKK
ncbi:MAG TPA: PTS transporter subunit EIIC [Candidatus Onthocola gallistercoris]|uniref:PTS transporter subunit EIIC n=1 Tax=Candidatus Onthocola gallistercoris TaxID=2840876 RepID=A0A9D1HFZ6_9FIRM|nr:PTS transporter subunit EIIC [Candidatus Onthocola gallistercoris]